MRRAESIQYQLFMLALCVYTLVALALEAVLRPAAETRALLQYADKAVCGVFLVDFFLCLYRAEYRCRNLYTWGWLDLASSIPAVDVARWGRAARAARVSACYVAYAGRRSWEVSYLRSVPKVPSSPRVSRPFCCSSCPAFQSCRSKRRRNRISRRQATLFGGRSATITTVGYDEVRQPRTMLEKTVRRSI